MQALFQRFVRACTKRKVGLDCGAMATTNGAGKPRDDMAGWLGNVLAQARINAHVTQLAIAQRAGVSEAKVYRFEAGETWPRFGGPDELLAVYAELLGVDDPRDFLQLMLDRWRLQGTAPVAPTQRAVAAAQKAAARTKRTRREAP